MASKNPQLDEFHRTVGRALTTWQDAETVLFLLAHCILKTDYKLSSIVFFQIRSADNKLKLVEALCEKGLPKKAYDKWTPLRKELSDCLGKRNFVAHGEVGQMIHG